MNYSAHSRFSAVLACNRTKDLILFFPAEKSNIISFSASFPPTGLKYCVNFRVWDVNTGEMLNTLIHHCEAVLHLRFNNGMMVTCSKDRSIAVWDMASPTDITLRRVLVGHRAAVNVVDFDDKYIVSASGDRTIKVRNLKSCLFTALVIVNQEELVDS